MGESGDIAHKGNVRTVSENKSSLIAANGARYPRVGGRRQRHFAGTSLKPRELPENAQTPTRRMHAVLGGLY